MPTYCLCERPPDGSLGRGIESTNNLPMPGFSLIGAGLVALVALIWVRAASREELDQ